MYQINPTKLSTKELRYLKLSIGQLQDNLLDIGCHEHDRACELCAYKIVCTYFRDIFISCKKELLNRGEF